MWAYLKGNKALFTKKNIGVLLPLLLFIYGCTLTDESANSKSSFENASSQNTLALDAIINVNNRWITTEKTARLAQLHPTDGHIVYGQYSNEKRTNRNNILPDFSYAGFKKGGVALPKYSDLPIVETLFAINNGDNTLQIQQAINKVSALPLNAEGYRGVILLSKGTYNIEKELIVAASGVVIRGEGQDDNGTLLISTATTHRATLLSFKGQGNGVLPSPATSRRKTAITQQNVPVGSNVVTVTSSEGYSVGDEIAIVRTPNNAWLGKSGINTAKFGWKTKGYALAHERVITAINGNILTFDIPMVDTIEDQLGGGYVYRINVSKRLNQVGLENLQLQTTYKSNVTNENRGFYGVSFSEVQHSWVRDVTVKYFSHAYNLKYGARFNTLENVALVKPNFRVKGGRHYAFYVEGGSFNLFQRCYGHNVRHTFVTGSRATGPNVFLDCTAEKSKNDSGPHHRWATGTLFDNTQGYQLRVQNRKTSGSGHGWAGAQQLLWNSDHDEYVLQTPPFAMNWAVGITGKIIDGQWTNSEATGIIESHGKRVKIRSLYLQQLQDRLGKKAVEAVTIPQQREGTIWALLKKWQGDGNIDEYK